MSPGVARFALNPRLNFLHRSAVQEKTLRHYPSSPHELVVFSGLLTLCSAMYMTFRHWFQPPFTDRGQIGTTDGFCVRALLLHRVLQSLRTTGSQTTCRQMAFCVQSIGRVLKDFIGTAVTSRGMLPARYQADSDVKQKTSS
jgi:hypothetical protein